MKPAVQYAEGQATSPRALKPATPLPWESSIAGQTIWGLDAVGMRADTVAHVNANRPMHHARQDAAYIAHAANSYPQLLALLRSLPVPRETGPDLDMWWNERNALFAKLGETL